MRPFFLTGNGILQLLFFISVLASCIRPLGAYISRVYRKKATFLDPIVAPIENLIYRIARINPDHEMPWQNYATAVLSFGFAGFLLLYLILRIQFYLPFNPQNFSNVSPDLAFNIAASFTTNTNWQSYGGETTLSIFSQMVGLVVQHFLSCSMGLAILMVTLRGISRRNSQTIGNFWVDLIRGILYILLPLSFIWALLLGSQGVVQSFSTPTTIPLTETSNTLKEQQIVLGPVASQIAIKQLGSNGGGYYNANSSHPFENPTPLSNFAELLAILLLPVVLCYTYGAMVRDRRQGWAIFATMTVLYIPLMLAQIWHEQQGNFHLDNLPINQRVSTVRGHEHSGGNMEGKETRFGILNSSIWASATTTTSNGSTNSSLDSFTPLGGAVSLLLIQFGEIIYGGVGSGLYGMFMFIIIAVFIAGLMVGRTPEYVGKKIQSFEIKMASIAILIPPLIILLLTAIAVSCQAGRDGIFNPGAQGFTEILYAFTSAVNNNGSSFAGIKANTPFYNILTGIGMLFGRYWLMIPVLAIAGSMASHKMVPHSVGTMATHTPLFIIFLIGTIYIVGVLTYLTTLVLGPIVEYLAFIPSS